MGDERLQMAYDAGKAALAQQDTTLGNIRNRATGLLTTAGLATSFAAGLGLLNTDPTKGSVFPIWAAFTLIGLFAAIGVISIAILWPMQFGFGPDSGLILSKVRGGSSTDEIVFYVAGELTRWRGVNDTKLKRRMRAFEAGGILLIVEIGVLIGALASR